MGVAIGARLGFKIVVCILSNSLQVDLGTGNNNKINWAMSDGQEFIDIIETVYRGTLTCPRFKIKH